MENEIELPSIPAEEIALKSEFIGGLNFLASIADPETWAWLDRIEIERDEDGQARLIPVWIA
jgi:hypothetical protein